MISDFLAYLIVYCPLITTVCLFSPNDDAVRRQRLFYVLHNCRVPVYEKDVRMDTPPLSDLTRFFQATILTGFLLLTCSCQWEESAYWSQGWPINPFVLLSILQSSIVILESSDSIPQRLKITQIVAFGFFDFKNSPKWTILSTQNVNVARFARNLKWDFFCDFQSTYMTF